MSDRAVNIEVVKDTLSAAVLDCAFYVHQQLGPGLLESAYEDCLSLILLKNGIAHRRQVTMPIEFDGHRIEDAYRVDVIVDNKIILELKAVEKILPVHEAQILTYLKLSKIRTGFLMNFNSRILKEGLKRYVV